MSCRSGFIMRILIPSLTHTKTAMLPQADADKQAGAPHRCVYPLSEVARREESMHMFSQDMHRPHSDNPGLRGEENCPCLPPDAARPGSQPARRLVGIMPSASSPRLLPKQPAPSPLHPRCSKRLGFSQASRLTPPRSHWWCLSTISNQGSFVSPQIYTYTPLVLQEHTCCTKLPQSHLPSRYLYILLRLLFRAAPYGGDQCCVTWPISPRGSWPSSVVSTFLYRASYRTQRSSPWMCMPNVGSASSVNVRVTWSE